MTRIPPHLDDFDTALPVEVGRWYVIMSLSRQERKAVDALTELKIQSYLPLETYKHPLTHRQRIEKGREWEPRKRPVLPGYLFALLTDEQIPKVKAIDVVTGIISDQGRPVPVQLKDIMWVAWFEGSGEFDLTWSPKKERWKPKRGSPVKVVSGPYAGKAGEIETLKNKNRATVIMSLFGLGAKPYDIPISDLEAA